MASNLVDSNWEVDDLYLTYYSFNGSWRCSVKIKHECGIMEFEEKGTDLNEIFIKLQRKISACGVSK
jgi:hypothetical protein